MESPRRPRPEVAAAFSGLAEELPLELIDADVEVRCVGVAFIISQRTIDVPVDTADESTVSASTEIAAHLLGFESLSPADFPQRWREYATDPYVGVGVGWVGTIDEKAVDEWLHSSALAEAEEALPTFSPRHVKLSNLQLVALGPGRYLATYRVEETYRNDEVSAGNTFAVLFRVRDQGWRIAVASKGTRHEAVLRNG
jgi:hypothetical protein